jgi:hypothetical protein
MLAAMPLKNYDYYLQPGFLARLCERPKLFVSRVPSCTQPVADGRKEWKKASSFLFLVKASQLPQ